MIRCSGWDRPPHLLQDGHLGVTPDGAALCDDCGRRYRRGRKVAWIVSDARERPLYVITGEHVEPVETKDAGHRRLALALLRQADPERAASLLDAHRGIGLELVLADDGSASVWVSDTLVHRSVTEDRDAAA